jgi:hypothetical protein
MKTSLESGLLKLLICFVSLSAGGLCAQPAAGPVAPPANNRYLLIVDISRAMDTRTRGTLKVVQELLKSDMSGQMKPGDTLGVWTYNADLYTGRFPLQRWSPDGQKAITSRLLTFLRGQKYEKAADLDKVLVATERVIKDSQLITVILVSAGDGQIHGTPFDDRINEFWRRWHDQQAAAHMPFVIVLRARNGEITDYTLNTPPWAVQMPYLPVETQIAAPTPSPVHEAPRPVQPPTAPPLIVSGKKSKPLPAPKAGETTPAKPEPPAPASPSEAGKKEGPPAPPAVTEKAEAAKAEVMTTKVEAPVPSPAAVTNASEPAKVEPPKPSPPVAEAAPPQPAPAAPAKAATEVPPTRAEAPLQPSGVVQPPAPVADPAPKAETVKATEPASAGSAPVPPSVAPATPIRIAKPAPEVVEAPKPAPAPEVKTAPAPVPPATPVASSSPGASAPEVRFPTPQPASSLQPPSAAATPPVQIAAASPAKTPEILSKLPVWEGERPREPKHPQESPEIRRREDARPPRSGFETVSPPASDRKAEPAPLPWSPREVRPAASATATNAGSLPAVPSSAVPAPSASPPAAVQTAVVAPAGSPLSHKNIWLAGVVLAGVMLGFALLLLRRSRAMPHASLITRSLDREKKP